MAPGLTPSARIWPKLSPPRFHAGGVFLPGCHRNGTYAASTIHRRRDASPTFRAWRLGCPSICADALALGRAMVKEAKFFQKQAAKAERMARSTSDPEISQSFLNMAKAYRSQADLLKMAKKKADKKHR